MTRNLICLALFTLLSLRLSATASDSIDVLHYSIYIDTIENGQTKAIYAHTQVRLTPTVNNISNVTLDLLRLNITNIEANTTTTTWSYNDTLLNVHLPSAQNPGDTLTIEIWYDGTPRKDPLFGGFYFQGSYVFNIGVGLEADPHNYGRVWFPCKDNFRDRATFDFYIRADTGQAVACNGVLQSTLAHGDGTQTWHWHMQDNIPTYLAGMAVAPYQRIDDNYISITGDTIPFQIYALAADTTNAKNQSSNLKTGMLAFENLFGPYQWDRIGYVSVSLPLGAATGAMEHATNIVYPRVLLQLGQSFETVWAHEVAHGWFGNLVTCEEAEEMWLNEGWATYCETIFRDAIYGPANAKAYLREQHSDALRRGPVEDGFQPLSGMPTDKTYGRTTYLKGATVTHTLRHQLGDSAFFPGIRQYLNDRQWSHVHSDSLRMCLEAYSGQPLQDFFDGWVSQPGHPHYAVDSMSVVPNGPNFDATVHIRQRLRGATTMVDSFWLPLQFRDGQFGAIDTLMQVSGALTSATFTLPWSPAMVAVDPEEEVMDATTDSYRIVQTTGSTAYPQTWCTVDVDALPDSNWIRVIHNWVAPDSFKVPMPGIRLSNARYWTVEMRQPAGFHATANFQYNATANAISGLLDHTWLTGPEDSLLLLYRPGPAFDWAQLSNTTFNIGAPNDRVGSVDVADLLPGEYTLALFDAPTGIAGGNAAPDFQVHPNPSDGSFRIRVADPLAGYSVDVLDLKGNKLYHAQVETGQLTHHVRLDAAPSGVYLVILSGPSGPRKVQRVMISR